MCGPKPQLCVHIHTAREPVEPWTSASSPPRPPVLAPQVVRLLKSLGVGRVDYRGGSSRFYSNYSPTLTLDTFNAFMPAWMAFG